MAMHPMLNTAVRAARDAGRVILRSAERSGSLTVETKQRNDFVTEVGRQAETAIISRLHKAYPDHAILAEESGGHGDAEAEYQWIIDPLDGTTNFLHGFPQFAVSIALQQGKKLEQAVVYDPVSEELFTATRGGGAYLNNRRIRVSNRRTLEGALLGTGFPYRPHQDMERYLKTFRALYPGTAGIRRAGSAALDLAYVAAGRLDGFWEFELKPWDMAAGALLIREAGGLITDFQGEGNYLKNGNVLCANPKLFHQMLQKLEGCLEPEERG